MYVTEYYMFSCPDVCLIPMYFLFVFRVRFYYYYYSTFTKNRPADNEI